jgi:hypothetical protein
MYWAVPEKTPTTSMKHWSVQFPKRLCVFGWMKVFQVVVVVVVVEVVEAVGEAVVQ